MVIGGLFQEAMVVGIERLLDDQTGEVLAMNQIPQSSTDKGCLGCPCLQVCSDRQDWCSLYDERPKGLNPLPICIQERPQIVVKEEKKDEMSG